MSAKRRRFDFNGEDRLVDLLKESQAYFLVKLPDHSDNEMVRFLEKISGISYIIECQTNEYRVAQCMKWNFHIYTTEARSAALCALWCLIQKGLVKDVAKMIAQMVFATREDEIWEQVKGAQK